MWTSGYLDPRLSSVLSKYGGDVFSRESDPPHVQHNSGSTGDALSPPEQQDVRKIQESETQPWEPESPTTNGEAPFRILILFGSSGGTSAAIAFSLFHSLCLQLRREEDAYMPSADFPVQEPHSGEKTFVKESKGPQPNGVDLEGGADSEKGDWTGISSSEHIQEVAGDSASASDSLASPQACGARVNGQKGKCQRRGDRRERGQSGNEKKGREALDSSDFFSDGGRAAETALGRARRRVKETQEPVASGLSSRKLWFLDRAYSGGVEVLIQSMEFFSFDDLLALSEGSALPFAASQGISSIQRSTAASHLIPPRSCSPPGYSSAFLSASVNSASSSSPTRLLILFCLATGAQGSPPSTAAAFCAEAEEATKDFRVGKNTLSRCFVAGIGCGSSEYPRPTFCRPAKTLFRNLTGHLGALPLLFLPLTSQGASAPLSAPSTHRASSAVSTSSSSSLLLLSDTHTERSLEAKVKNWEGEVLRRLVAFLKASRKEQILLLSRATEQKSGKTKELSGKAGRKAGAAECRAGSHELPGAETIDDRHRMHAIDDERATGEGSDIDTKGGDRELQSAVFPEDSHSSSDSGGESSDRSSLFSSDDNEDGEAPGWSPGLSVFASGKEASQSPCGTPEGNADLEDMVECGREARPRSEGGPGSRGSAARGKKGKSAEKKAMVSEKQAAQLKKEGYKLIGSHSAVKLCRWTKSQLRGRGGCYKHTFYGITSSQCMELTPSLACANKCVFCWRHHKNPVGTSWRWQLDNADFIVEEGLKNHFAAIKELKGMAEVNEERLASARAEVRHCALSLVGEPIMYPRIAELVKLLHHQHISTFLVTNAQFPEALRTLPPVTQLYVSVDAANPKDLKTLDQPLFADYWERFLSCLDLLKEKRQRTVYRLTLVGGYNMDDPSANVSKECHTGAKPQGSSAAASAVGENSINEVERMCCRPATSGNKDDYAETACGCLSPRTEGGQEKSPGEETPQSRAAIREEITGEKADKKRGKTKTEGQSLTDRSAAAYARLVLRGSPDLIEVKAVTYAGTSKHSKLTMKNIPWHDEVVAFCQTLCDALPTGDYAIACEHRHSCCVLIAKTSYRRDGVWHTWIDYDKFHQLATSGNTTFTGFDYCAPTPSWAVYGSAEAGFSPLEKRVFSKGKQKRLLRDKARTEQGENANGAD
ncbi:radical SAM domain-containing protein [Toxoplasma gondii VEG]|uniref:tRNA 4-demethylwyosine synthase (AdoMet-dependent) n=2 Tax=Toxoplasma gondii TaxID=5811 RepID=V4ZQR4_TOXGV|nr:radical SAM domain-containing protein [Toxoplasma gondii VEG]CEL75191.1 TPA: radical SAM domain-containing protein [Toxoplasma gondii VEG]